MRSLIFWSGLFLLVSLLGAWADSRYFTSSAVSDHGCPAHASVRNDSAGLTIELMQGELYKIELRAGRRPVREAAPIFATPRLDFFDHLGHRGAALVLPHWLLLVTALLLWYLLLILQHRHLSAPAPP